MLQLEQILDLFGKVCSKCAYLTADFIKALNLLILIKKSKMGHMDIHWQAQNLHSIFKAIFIFYIKDETRSIYSVILNLGYYLISNYIFFYFYQ